MRCFGSAALATKSAQNTLVANSMALLILLDHLGLQNPKSGRWLAQSRKSHNWQKWQAEAYLVSVALLSNIKPFGTESAA